MEKDDRSCRCAIPLSSDTLAVSIDHPYKDYYCRPIVIWRRMIVRYIDVKYDPTTSTQRSTNYLTSSLHYNDRTQRTTIGILSIDLIYHPIDRPFQSNHLRNIMCRMIRSHVRLGV